MTHIIYVYEKTDKEIKHCDMTGEIALGKAQETKALSNKIKSQSLILGIVCIGVYFYGE